MYVNNIKLPSAFQLDMVDQIIDHNYMYPSHNYSDLNVSLFVLDTGVYSKHTDFAPGQVIDVDPSFGIANITNAHGTGTSSAASGIHFGTSKNITIYNYPVCRYGGSCGSGDIERGFMQVLNYLKTYNPNVNGSIIWNRRVVINLSVGSYVPNISLSNLGIYYNSIFQTINQYGGIMVVASGNSNMNACDWLFGFSNEVISVGSINQNYIKSGFSNYGDCVDIYAFGENVPLAYSFSNDSIYQYKSGTSFSSPYIAGLVVNILLQNPSFNRNDVLRSLYNVSSSGLIVPNYLCNSNPYYICSGRANNSRLVHYCNSIDNLLYCNGLCQIALR